MFYCPVYSEELKAFASEDVDDDILTHLYKTVIHDPSQASFISNRGLGGVIFSLDQEVNAEYIPIYSSTDFKIDIVTHETG